MSASEQSLMIIQCDSGDVNANLIASARYCVMDEYELFRKTVDTVHVVHVVFVVQLPRKAGGCFTGFQVYLHYCIDDEHICSLLLSITFLTKMFS